MGQKDLEEKLLEDYDDVFSDIINVLLFHGKQMVVPEALENTTVHSQYKADDSTVHEQERDVFKYWKGYNIHLAALGIENQTQEEKYMPVRVIGYDGAAYRKQYLKKKDPIAPVITLVLYFGTEKKWSTPCSLKELLNIPEGLEEYVNDYKIHVFNIAWLDEVTMSKFTSDFGIVANFFVNKRKDKNYIPSDSREIIHVDEVLKLLSIMTKDNRYEQILSQEPEVHNMCEVAERLENKGRAEERAIGLSALVKTLKPFLPTFQDLVQAVRNNDVYKEVSEDEIRKYY